MLIGCSTCENKSKFYYNNGTIYHFNYGYEFLADTFQSGFFDIFYGTIELLNIKTLYTMSVSGFAQQKKTVFFNFMNTESVIVRNCYFSNTFVNSFFSIKI